MAISRVNLLQAELHHQNAKFLARTSALPSVLMIMQDLGALGGAEQQAWRLAQGLRHRQVPVEIATGSWRGQKPGMEIVEGIPIHYLPTMGQWIEWRGGNRLSRYVMMMGLLNFLWWHRHRYNVLHCHENEFMAATGVLFGRLNRKRVVTKMRASGEWSDLQYIQRNWRGPERPALIAMLRQTDCIVSLNEESTAELVTAGFQPERITRMVNGIDVEKFTPRLDYTLNKPPKIVFVGRLEPQKDIGTLLKAVKLVNRPNLQLLIIGEGNRRNILEETTKSLGLREQVTFCGRVSEVTPFLATADLFVLPSIAEGISNALLEAMACGLPCLVSDIPGNRTVITHEKDGFLFPVKDSAALAHLLEKFLTDEALRRRIGQAGRATVMQQFSLQAVVEAYLSLYNRLINM